MLAGSGSQPFSFSGPVYLTGPYKGSPYGLSIKVPAVAGPFNFGTVVTRAGITVNQFTSQVIVSSTLPRIRQGIPLRIRNISVAVNKPGFMINPTNCGAFKTVSNVGSFTTLEPGGATGSAITESPFQVANCNALKFAPKFKAISKAKTSRSNGAELTTEVTQSAGQANIKSVKVQLPRSLPSRLTTLQKACTEQVFAANPLRCPSGAFVGGAVVKTPTLPQPLRGPAILVSHAGAAFPDLDLVVEDPNHLKVILVGNTNIKNSITTTTFASTPDVPVSSVRVELPIGSHSALAAFGNICAKSLVMPTTIDRAERQDVQTEHDHQRRRVSRRDRGPQGGGQLRLHHGTGAGGGPRQRDRHVRRQDDEESQESAPERHAEGAAERCRSEQKAPDRPRPHRVRAQEGQALEREHQGHVPLS